MRNGTAYAVKGNVVDGACVINNECDADIVTTRVIDSAMTMCWCGQYATVARVVVVVQDDIVIQIHRYIMLCGEDVARNDESVY